MRYVFTLLSLIICSLSIAVGQPPKGGRTCRILFLAAPDDAPKTIFLNDGTTTQQVELPSLNLSDVYKLAPGNITLRLCTAIPTDEQPIPAGVPAVAVREAIVDCYLLIASDPKNTVMPLQCQVVNADPAGFRMGQMMWINLSPYQVGGQVGSRTINLKPQSQAIMESPLEGTGYYPVKIGYVPEKDQNAAVLVTTQWLNNPIGRMVVFIMILPNSRIPRIKGYSDYREPEKAKSPEGL